MTDKDFSLYNNFATAILVFDSIGKVVFENVSFIKTFGSIKNLEKFSDYFNFDVCLLDSDPESIRSSNPVNFALNSEESFCAHVIYQKEKELYFKIISFWNKGYKIVGFEDLTDSVKYEGLEKNYTNIQKKYNELEHKNKDFANVQQIAQNHAVKMALMHRVSNVIRESIDLSKIIDSALKELSGLFGAIKVYYAPSDNKSFFIKQVYPAKFKSVIGDKVELERDTLKDIGEKDISISPCRKEYPGSSNTFDSSTDRIIVPVYKFNELLGILMIYTKNSAAAHSDILQSISEQLASAIVQASLFQEINLKNEELEKTLKELKETQLQLIHSEKMASLGQLVAGVAHEINTPLASIKSNNDILNKLQSKLTGKIDNEKLIQTFNEINKLDKEAVRRINQIVQSLKRFVRLDESELQEADINKELDLTLDLIQHETKNKVRIIKEYSELPRIKCYPNMLNQVFMNVLINACQSIKQKGEITIKTEFILAGRSGLPSRQDRLKITVKDTGSGIDDEIKDKIFSAGITTKKTGMGLGLAISQKIIEKHNGSITFTSEKGKGTEFVIEIPAG